MGSQRVGHDWVTLTFISLHWWLSDKESACQCRRRRIPGSGKSPGEGNGNPVQYPCLENPMDCSQGLQESNTIYWLNHHHHHHQLKVCVKFNNGCLKTNPLISREMQIKSRMRYHFTPVRMAITKRSTNNMCLRGCGGRGTLPHCWWECKLI